MKKILTSLIVSILSISSLYGAYNDANTDYTNAKTDFWTRVDALAPLEAINQIICFTQQLHPELMVNKGVYSALIDNKKCSKTQSTNQNTENEYILANVVRENDTSSQIMNIWITEDNQDDVKVRMEVIKEPSDTNPIGQFNITWKLFNSGIQTGEAEIKTILTNDSKVGYTLYMNFDNVKTLSSIIKNPNGTQGRVITSMEDLSKTYALSWDDDIAENLVLSKVQDGQVFTVDDFNNTDTKTCQDKNNSKKSVWSYGVFKKDNGSLLTVNTGFPFEGEKDGKIIQGYVGYWGLWIEGNETIGNIYNIKKINYIDDTKTDITISKVNTKFIAKYTNGDEIPFDQPITLKDDNNNTFMYGENGSLWNSSNTNPVILKDETTLNYNENDYVVKGLQGENILQDASGGQSDCNDLTLEDPAEPLPTSVSTNAVFNEDNIPNRPANVSIVNGELKN
jgi:hypothetical protein